MRARAAALVGAALVVGFVGSTLWASQPAPTPSVVASPTLSVAPSPMISVAPSSTLSAAPLVAALPTLLVVPSPAALPTPLLVPSSSPSITVARAEEDDALERELRRARIVALKPVGELSNGAFEATIEAPGSARRETARLTIALIDEPYVNRRPLAFYRLAKALGAHGVPASIAMRLSAGELGEKVAREPLLLTFFKARASIQNDGTIDALLRTPSPAGSAAPFREPSPDAREIAMNGSVEMEAWAAWARERAPLPGDQMKLLREYVEMLALDYLSANVLRKTALYDEASASLMLVDNATAFPLHSDAQAEAPILDKLRECARFPRELRDRLLRFDKTAAAAALAPGGFDTWLVSPRNLVTLDERRAGLLTLIEAKIAEAGGERDVLSL